MLKDKYKKLKEDYPKSIIFIKSGTFFIALNKDAIIINKLLNYKIKELSDNYIRIGFPISSINKVQKILTQNEINYVVYTEKIVDKAKFNNNKYNEYLEDTNDYELAKNKIKYINEILKDNLFNPNIIDILNDIERVLCKINY